MKFTQKRTFYILAVIAFLLVNYLLRNASLRLDLSKNNAYTLSDSSKKIIKGLKNPVTLTFYSSGQLPSRLQPAKRDVQDLLSEYKNAGGSNVTIVYKDPKKDEKTKQEAVNFGIPELNFSQQERDQYAITTGYFGIGIAVGNKKAAIPQAADIGDLEYNLTSAIYKITVDELPSIGLMGGDNPEQQFNTLRAASATQFNLQDVASPSANLKTAILIDNREKEYSEEELSQLESYVKGGGKLIVMADGVWVRADLQTGEANHQLYPFLKKFGIVLNRDLVLSTAAEIVNFGGRGNLQVVTAYPYWVRSQRFDRETSYFSNIRQLTFPWTASTGISHTNNVKLGVLARTVQNSWSQAQSFTLTPQEIRPPASKDFKQMNLIAEATLQNGGRLMLIPASRFVEDQFLVRTSDNLEFALNVMSDYASNGALSGIRQRAVDLYPLPADYTNEQKDLFKYLTILLLPGMFAAFGTYRLVKRK